MHEQAQNTRPVGKAVLLTILATAALVALNPLSADGARTDGQGVLQVTELA